MGVTARIVVRVTDEATGKRRWVPVTGKRTDPQGSHYLRHCVGSKPQYQHAGDRYDIALAEKIKLERRLKAAELGAVIPEEPVTKPAAEQHRIDTAIKAYLDDLTESRRPLKILKSKRSELKTFAEFCGKTHVEEITRGVLIT
jgi:hypothetical protein